ncbi:macrophage colony-stimulating factor 1 receptor 2 [Diretmus argenteus]
MLLFLFQGPVPRSWILSRSDDTGCSRDLIDPPPPSIRLNSDLLLNQTELVLSAGSNITLRCHGNGSVRWSSTAFRLRHRLTDTVTVRGLDRRHTGTYRCAHQNLKHLNTWIHIYVKDPARPASLFVTPRNFPDMKEGQDFLFECLLTDPSVTNLAFRLEDDVGSGRGLPTGMNVTLDPQKGALVHNLSVSYRGSYVCSAWREGREYTSNPVDLRVIPRLRFPPTVSVSPDEIVRLEGERLEVTCLSSNPSHRYNVTWTHTHTQVVNVSISRRYIHQRMYMNSTLTVAAVNHTHSGYYTCTAVNEAGVTMATARLRVADGPYLRVYLQNANVSAKAMEVNGELLANVSANRVEGNEHANISGVSRVEVYEGQNMKLTFAIEAYPPIIYQRWTTPTNNNNYTTHQESYATNNHRSEASLLLRRVRQEDRGCYSLHFSSSFFSGSQNVDLRVYRSPSAAVKLRNGTLTCSSSGYPLPTILWYICPGVMDTCGGNATYQVFPIDTTFSPEEQEEEEVQKHLTLPFTTNDNVTVECVASNHVGVSHDIFVSYEVLTSKGVPPKFFTPTLIVASVAAAVFFLLLLVVFKYKQKPKYEIRWKIIESNHGNSYSFIDPTQLPYNQKWEFPRDKLRLGAVLGSGAFGKVVEATAYGLGTNDNITRVAVKMLKPSAHSEEREALMSELKILSHLGYHNNIVNLLGACTLGGPMLMITEYCSHGDLLNFLRGRAQDLMAILNVEDGGGEEMYKQNMAARQARVRSDSGISCCSEYQEMQPVLTPNHTDQGGQTDSWCFGDLMLFSYQVAQGLDFLSSRNCIHRDVAARNVLLTNLRVAKICDFGLARDIRNDDSYIVQGNARLPVKWMAPESIFQCVYTVQSDVWSYGVLLWEIFSLGKSPYPNVAVDTNFYKMIKDGRHMSRPDFAPPEMYELMIHCWSLEPTQRPTFKAIGQLIKRLIPLTNDVLPLHNEEPTYRNIQDNEDEEARGGENMMKGGEEEDIQQEPQEEEEAMMNIYQVY